MATYMIRGLEGEQITAFKKRCRDAGISPDKLLLSFLTHVEPAYHAVDDVTTVTCRITFHHPPDRRTAVFGVGRLTDTNG